MNCLGYLLILFGAAFALLTLLRLFEQMTEVVDARAWGRAMLLLACPFMVWAFESRVAAGRPTAVPRHEPVRGFGSLPKPKPQPIPAPTPPPPTPPATPTPSAAMEDQPPPGTPAEFLVKPVVPKRVKPLDPVDPDKIEKLKRKMREQGMLGDD